MSLSTDKILIATKNMVGRLHKNSALEGAAAHLDIGSGHGNLISLLRTEFDFRSAACDYTDSLMLLKDVKVDVVNLNTEKLPYSDASFDLVTCTEVLEHLEHYRETLREVLRVLRMNGTLVLTTPNILNLKSRVRFMTFGFYNLFGPLHFRESALHTTGGHINPIGLFFLIHSLIDAGFSEIEVTIDKKQGTSRFWLLFLYLPIQLFSAITRRKEITKYNTIDSHNEPYVKMINRMDILLGRTIVVGCKKRSGIVGVQF